MPIIILSSAIALLLIRHRRECGAPDAIPALFKHCEAYGNWIAAFAGMTISLYIGLALIRSVHCYILDYN